MAQRCGACSLKQHGPPQNSGTAGSKAERLRQEDVSNAHFVVLGAELSRQSAEGTSHFNNAAMQAQLERLRQEDMSNAHFVVLAKTDVWFDPQAGRVVADGGPGRVRIPACQAAAKTDVWFDPQAGRVVADDGPGRVRIPACQAAGRVPLRRREEALLQLHQNVVIVLQAQAEKATVTYTSGGNVQWAKKVDCKSWTQTALGRLFNDVLQRLRGVDQERQAVIAVMRALQPGLWRESIVQRYNRGPVQ